MQFRTKIIVGLLLTLLIVGIVGYFLSQSIEIVKQEVYVGLKGQARTNQFLAAERLLLNRDFNVHHIYNEYQITRFMNDTGTIFFSEIRDSFNPHTLEKLIGWVESGGNLIISAAPYQEDIISHNYIDYFLEYVNVEVDANPDIDFDEGESPLELQDIKFTLPGIAEELVVTLDNYIILCDTDNWASWIIEHNGYNLLLQFKIGKGLLSIASSLSFMRNSMIGEKDNVALFWYLVSQGSPENEVWFIWRRDVRSFWEILFHYAWMFLASLFICLIFFIWKQGRRFGPVIKITDTVRRSIIEHVYASGRFLWNNKEHSTLLQALKQAVMNKLKLKPLVWNRDTLFEAYYFEYLKKITGLNEEEIDILINSEMQKTLSKKDFLHQAQILERMYEKL
jgi:hypothetical protein